MSQPTARPTTRAEAKARGRGAAKTPKGRRWLRRILWAGLASAVLGLAVLAVVYAKTPIPEPNEMATAQTSIVYFSDGKTEMGRLTNDINRESIPLKNIPLPVQRAFLAAEDRTFYENQGVSPSGLARAVKAAVTGGPTVGGSTVTQQYVKNYYLTQEQTVTRKLKEIMISLKIDRQLTKDEILDSYLNTIYFGRGADGIQTASKAYFNKDASKLTVTEGAFLASVIRGPSYYDPALGESQMANAQERWAYVLDGMVTQGWLSQGERDSLTFPKLVKPPVRASLTGTNGYLIQMVREELLEDAKLTDAEIDRDGLRIVTTFDKAKQAAAVKAVEKLPKEPKDLRVGLASIVPNDGAVVALYGGKDYQKIQQNDAVQSTMQAGSTFKVFGLIAGLQSDLSILSRYNGSSPQYFKEFTDSNASSDLLRRGGVRNFGNSSYGNLNLIDATARSVNTIYAQVNIAATPKKTAAAAKAAGVRTKLNPVYANVLGTDNVSVIDMANAYATIAAQGVRAEPYVVSKVTSVSKPDYSYKVKKTLKPVFDKKLMADVIACLRAVVDNGSGSYAGQRLDRPAAGKTGTTTDNYAAWFDGFTPNLATSVGIYRGNGGAGNPDNQMNDIPGIGQMTGATVPIWIWTDYMESALKGMKVVDFPEPAYINKDKVRQPTRTGPGTSTTPRPKPSTSTSTPAPSTSTPAPPPVTTAPPQTQPPVETNTPPPVTETATPPGGGGGGGGGSPAVTTPAAP